MLNLSRFSRRSFAGARRALIAAAMHLSILALTTGCGSAPMAGAEYSRAMEAPGGMAMPPPPPMPAAAPPPVAAPASESMQYDMPSAAAAGAPAPMAPSRPGAAKAPAARGPSPAKAPVAAKPPAPTKPAPTTPATKAADKAPPGNDKQAAAPSGPTTPAAPLLIYVGDLQSQVLEEAAIPASIDKVIDVAESLGGYLAGRKDASVQVRIPSAYFREGFTRIEQIAEVLHRSVTADDVSEQYSDLEVRLTNLRVTHKRLQEFLAKTGTIADMLTVSQELERVAGEIEAIEGKMRFLRSRAAFSTVSVSFTIKPKVAVVVAQKDPPPPPPREISLPIPWLPKVGLDNLLNLH